MYIYDKEKNELVEVEETTYSENNLKERDNIEEWIRKNPSIIDEDLLIIAHEYDKFDIKERLDLLAVDKDGALAIIELKRDDSGSEIEFQALKYCSYCSTLKPQDIIEIYQEYINKFQLNINCEESLLNHLEIDSLDILNNSLNNRQRIILASSNFDKRILSVAAWLSNNDIDIRCFSIKPFLKNNEIIVDIDQIIPPLEIDDYVIRKAVASKSKGRLTQPNEIISFFTEIVNKARKAGHKTYYYDQKSYCSIRTGKSNIGITLIIKKNLSKFAIEIVAKGENEKIFLFDIYENNKNEIINKTGLDFSIEKEGKYNAEWGRLLSFIEYDKSKSLNDYITDIGDVFFKTAETFKPFIK